MSVAPAESLKGASPRPMQTAPQNGPSATAPGFFRYGWLLAPMLVVPLISLAVLWVYLDVGVPRGFDTGFHLLRTASLDRLLRDGVFFPRWIPEMLLGYGYPLLNYYASAMYYVVELWHLLGTSLYQSLILTSVLTAMMAGFGAYLLAFDLLQGRKTAALVAAAMYMLAPYLMINVFNRGALSEAGAQALLPWLLWCGGRLFTARAPDRYAVGLALLMALLATMHTLTLFYAPLLLAIYLLLSWRELRRKDAAQARQRALWAIGALAAAAALSAFFWMPLLLERGYLSVRGYEIAREVLLETGVWRWQNFLDLNLIYENASERPVQLGAMQAALALLGLALGFWQGLGKDWRWWFWLAAAACSALLMMPLALPLWENSLLAAAQFPWRMLSILSLPLALFTGAIMLPVRRQMAKVLATICFLLLIVYTQTPRIPEKSIFDIATVRTDSPVLAMLDLDKGVLEGGEYNSSIQEFRPLWAPDAIENIAEEVTGENPIGDGATEPIQIEPVAMNETGMTLRVALDAANAPQPLVFSSFYFPGWRATLDGQTRLATYPGQANGLLTVDVPAGEHTLELVWEGTSLEKAASAITAITATLLGVALLFVRRLRWFALPFLLVGALSLWGWLWQSGQKSVQTPQVGYAEHGIELLGAQFNTQDTLWPTVKVLWHVADATPATLVTHLQVQDGAGEVVGEAYMRPWYNTSSASAWPIGAVVDDAYQIPLPAALPAGEYHLAVEMRESESLVAPDMNAALTPNFTFHLTQAVPPDPAPEVEINARVGEIVELLGYRTHPSSSTAHPGLSAVVHAGDQLRYSLYWRTSDTLQTLNHSFVHLLDSAGVSWAQRDQGPGPLAGSPEIWLPNRVYEDVHQIYIPWEIPSGVYSPIVGQYYFDTGERLPVWLPGSESASGEARLPQVKVLNPPVNVRGERVDAYFGTFAALERWRGPEATVVQPGDTLEFTLIWKSLEPTTVNYTRFLQIVDDTNRIIGQSDDIPQDTRNPTWSWIAGEVIEDTFTLTLDANAPAGTYRVIAGLYETETGTRAAAHTQAGAPYDANAVTLATLEVQP